jgi:hypothetical protein
MNYNIDQNNNPLNVQELDELKKVVYYYTADQYFNDFSRKNYNLFIKNVVFEPDVNNKNELYYLGLYYNNFNINYTLAKKYYLLAIEKENAYAMINMGLYYEYEGKNYDLMKKYYLQAIDKGDTEAMNNLGRYYRMTEVNYDLMEKYYLMAFEKGDHKSICDLGDYYYFMKKYYTAQRYYLMGIEMGNVEAANMLSIIYIDECIDVYRNSLCLFLNAIIKGNIRIFDIYLFDKINISKTLKYNLINAFYYVIDRKKLHPTDFIFCVLKIIKYINSDGELQKLKQFIEYISKLYYINKNKNKEHLQDLFNKETSQIFMEYLDYYYYKYLENKYTPDPPGSGYIKTKKHFESIINKAKK